MYKINWSEVNPPGSECHYDHVRGETPFGNILMTWKGWKDYISISLDESPWGAEGYAGSTVEDAKRAVEEEFNRRLQICNTQAILSTYNKMKDD